MRCVCVVAAVSVLLAGCSPWEGTYSSGDMDSVGVSSRAAAYTPDADVVGDHNARALRLSAWHPARIRGDTPTVDTAGFCKAVADDDAGTASYDPVTSRRMEAIRLAQCHAMMTP